MVILTLTQFNDDGNGLIFSNVKLDNGTVDVNGTSDGFILDKDGDTTLSANTDDVIDIKVAGSIDFKFAVNDFQVQASSKISGANSTTAPFLTTTVPQALSGAGALNVTSYLTQWTTTGADAGTLADGNDIGQLKKIVFVVDGGDGTLTPANFNTYSTVTFDDVGDYVILMWLGSEWYYIERGNMATGDAGPTVA